jgi:CBS domain-containing protein
MGAILGGTMRSPFTAIIFVFELTHDVNVLLPLFVAVAFAHGTTVLLLRRSILTEKVSRRGFHLSREYATDPLEILFVREVMGTEVSAIPASLSHAEAAATLRGKRRGQRLFVVVDDGGRLIGVVTRWVLERWAEEPDGSNGTSAASLVSIARKAVLAYPDEPLRVVVHRMAETGRTELPVVERGSPDRLLGVLTLEDTLKARVRHLEEERRRERVLPIRLVVPPWLRALRRAPTSNRSDALPDPRE